MPKPLNFAAGRAVGRNMDATDYEPPPCVGASQLFKQRGRWYARVHCPTCTRTLRVRLSLGPMVAHCERCVANVEADVTLVVHRGRA